MAEVCVLALGLWLERDVSRYLPFVSAARRESVARFRFPSDKNRSLWAELFARWRLAEAAGLSPSAVEIAHDEKGKPVWPGGGLALSLSHSGEYIAVAVGKEAIGVDVEKKRKTPPGVAKRWFRPEENALLESLPEPERTNMFFRLWTLKEAALKFAGEGLSGGLETVDCLALAKAAESGAKNALAGRSFPLGNGAVVSVVTRRESLPEAARFLVPAETAAGVYGNAGFAERAPILPLANGPMFA